MTHGFFDLAHDMCCIASADGRLLRVNAAWVRTLGWDVDELRTGQMDRFVHPDDVERTRAERRRLVAGGETTEFRNRYATKDGDWRWLEWRAVYHPETQQVFAAARDDTEQHELRRGLEVREELLTRVIAEQLRGHDVEHQRHANKLHDSVVQHLVAALMYLETAELAPTPEAKAAAVHGGIEQVRSSLQATRLVMQGLDPFDLGDHDLRSAIDELGRELEQQFPPRIELDVRLDVAPSPSLAKVAYRVVREALVNAGKHAEASSVYVRVRCTPEALDIEVRDDGRGLPGAAGDGSRTADTERMGTGLGLPTMHERVRVCNGQLRLHSDGSGTTLHATLPHEGAGDGVVAVDG